MSETTQPSRFYNRDALANPYPVMADMRREESVAKTVDPTGRVIYVVTKLALIEHVATSLENFSNDFGHLFMEGNQHPEVTEILAEEPMRATLLLASDDPDHKRYRSLVNIVFASGRVSRLAPVIEALADELIDGFVERGRCDFVSEFAVLFPTYIIADILGLPREQYGKVKQWSDAVITLVGRTGSKSDEIRAARDIVQFRRYMREAVAARRNEPKDDLISNLVSVRLDGVRPFNDVEAAALAFEIAVAGNETTRNTLMSGLVQLLRHPDQMRALIDDPTLIDNAVEEILRYETPASSMWRIARRDLVLGGVPIPAGATLLLRYDGGNRDPERFEDPDRFDIRRRNARMHITFGAPSVHRCLGQMLARKELTVAFPRLLTRLRQLRIDEGSEIAYLPSLMFHCIGKLNLAFEPGRRLLKS